MSMREAVDLLRAKRLSEAIVVDCSHENSRKRFDEQPIAWQDAVKQRLNGTHAIIGMMLESHLEEGQQDNTGDLATMRYGVSITDACISWATTEKLIRSAPEELKNARA